MSRTLPPIVRSSPSLQSPINLVTRLLQWIGTALAALLVTAILFGLWASSGRLPSNELAQTRSYGTEPTSEASDTLTVLTYNVGFLSGMTNNRAVARSESLFTANMEQAVDLFREVNPDLAALQEVDFGSARSFDVHQLDTLAARLGYPTAAQAVNWDERYLPFPYGRPAVHYGRTLSGQAVLSRFPVRHHRREVLVRPPQLFIRDAFYLDRLAQVALLDVGTHALALINVHLEAFATDTRERQAQTVNALYHSLARAGRAVVIAGDFNSVLSEETASGPVRDSTMQYVLEGTQLVAAPAVPGGGGTYPADQPTRTIDYIFYNPRKLRVTQTGHWCRSPNPPSDHCAVSASFVLRDTGELSSDPPSSNGAPLDEMPVN